MTGAQPSVLVIESDPDSGPGLLLDWIADAGLDATIVRAWAGEPVPPDSSTHAALIVLGGGMMPDDDAGNPWLPEVRALLAATADRGEQPVLGICLGGQLIANTFGGRVKSSHGLPEKGVVDLHLKPEAAGDPVFGSLPNRFPAIESHRDQITELPPDAIWLAESERCRYQLLRIGDRVWGLQFHPEVALARVQAWDRDKLRAWGFDPDTVVAEVERREPELRQIWGGAIGRFLAYARDLVADEASESDTRG